MLREKGFAWPIWRISAPSGRTHVVVSLKKRHDSTRNNCCIFCSPACRTIKHAVVVDDDVNVQDVGDVEWAIATRVQGDADLVIIPNLRARSIDPSKKKMACSPPRLA